MACVPEKMLIQFIGAHKFGCIWTVTPDLKGRAPLVFPVLRNKTNSEAGVQITKSNIGAEDHNYSIKTISDQ